MTIKASVSKLLQQYKDRVGASIQVPLDRLRGGTGLVTTATPADTVWAESISSDVNLLVTVTADSATKTAIGRFPWRVPDHWVPSQTLVVDVRVKLKSVAGTGVTNNGSTIDVTCFKQVDGAVGSDLCTTNAATFAALDTWYTKSFTIDVTTVRAGDILNFSINASVVESNAGNGTLAMHLESITLNPSDPS